MDEDVLDGGTEWFGDGFVTGVFVVTGEIVGIDVLFIVVVQNRLHR
jgi:hypothetical protein